MLSHTHTHIQFTLPNSIYSSLQIEKKSLDVSWNSHTHTQIMVFHMAPQLSLCAIYIYIYIYISVQDQYQAILSVKALEITPQKKPRPSPSPPTAKTNGRQEYSAIRHTKTSDIDPCVCVCVCECKGGLYYDNSHRSIISCWAELYENSTRIPFHKLLEVFCLNVFFLVFLNRKTAGRASQHWR